LYNNLISSHLISYIEPTATVDLISILNLSSHSTPHHHTQQHTTHNTPHTTHKNASYTTHNTTHKHSNWKGCAAGWIVMFALTFFFSSCGPLTTTYMIPSELFPTKWRATGYCLCAAAGVNGVGDCQCVS
jgi:Sugar (and other) transporter